jgi:hypothetical protein
MDPNGLLPKSGIHRKCQAQIIIIYHTVKPVSFARSPWTQRSTIIEELQIWSNWKQVLWIEKACNYTGIASWRTCKYRGQIVSSEIVEIINVHRVSRPLCAFTADRMIRSSYHTEWRLCAKQDRIPSWVQLKPPSISDEISMQSRDGWTAATLHHDLLDKSKQTHLRALFG